jgi:hypothetical protein
MKVRVLRIMEYTYDSPQAMEWDMSHWKVQGIWEPNLHTRIESTTLRPKFEEEENEIPTPAT